MAAAVEKIFDDAVTDRKTRDKTLKWVGTRASRPDGVDKVTGRAKFGADTYLPNMLHGKVLRSPHAHAKIINSDTSAVENLEGVKAVVTSKDLSQKNWTKEKAAIMAKDKVLYKGHPIAGVAAINHHIAEEALKLIKVDYEILPAVLTAPEGLDSSAPLIDETKKNNISIPFKNIKEVKEAYNFSNLESFLKIYYEGSKVLIKEEDFFDLTWAYALKCKEDNIVHAEIGRASCRERV